MKMKMVDTVKWWLMKTKSARFVINLYENGTCHGKFTRLDISFNMICLESLDTGALHIAKLCYKGKWQVK